MPTPKRWSTRLALVLAVAGMVWSSAVKAETGSSGLASQADQYLRQALEEHRIPAISAGIAVEGRIVWTGAAGLADLASDTPVTTQTPFRIASISKVMTAIATLKLVESGAIELGDPVQQYLPEYPAPRKGTMTLEQLLTHTSGIAHSRGDETRESVRHYESLAEASQYFAGRKPAFPPGKKYKYSSFGYTLLGAAIEAATGATFEAYLRDAVWAPAGMNATGLDKRPQQAGGAAGLYRLERDRLIPDTINDLSLIYPGGGMVSTAEDLLRMVIALEDGTLLNTDSIELMLGDGDLGGAVGRQPGGVGWNAWTDDKHGRILSRVGGQSGSSALLVSYIDRGVTVAFLTNVARLDPIWELTNHLIGIGLQWKD